MRATSIRIAPGATRDIEHILAWTQEHFGESGRRHYEILIAQAIRDIRDDPHRPGCVDRSEWFPGAVSYHLAFSRRRVNDPAQRVVRPRHFIVFRWADDGILEVGRVLHESMDPPRHLPDEIEEPGDPKSNDS